LGGLSTPGLFLLSASWVVFLVFSESQLAQACGLGGLSASVFCSLFFSSLETKGTLPDPAIGHNFPFISPPPNFGPMTLPSFFSWKAQLLTEPSDSDLLQ